MGFRFHAAAPRGQWLNDPNALVFENGRYRLFAQHVAGPAFGPVGWGALSSADLLDWRWDGVAFAPDATTSVFSGSMVRADDALVPFYTLHNRDARWETQHRNAGIAARDAGAPIGPAGANCRDPFVFFCAATGDWRMLVARPCDTNAWADDPPSDVAVWASPDLVTWTEAGRIGPRHPPGVMWEVPVLIDFGDTQALILSLVDRRGGGRACSVRYWLGRFDGVTFEVLPDFPDEGLLLDHGPDFYAAIPNVADGWPDAARVVIAWASNWESGTRYPWPGDVHGGPMTLPRAIACAEGRLRQAPVDSAQRLLARNEKWAPGRALAFELVGDRTRLDVRISETGDIDVTRRSDLPGLDWTAAPQTPLPAATEIGVFIDAGLAELFFRDDGRTLTAFVPGA